MKIIVLVGVPASGKSTWALDYYSKHREDSVIVNRDSIRYGRGEYWVPSQEKYIDDVEYSSVRSGLDLGYDVIVDATNLNPKVQDKWKTLANEYNAEIEFKEFYIPFEEAVKRDENPDRKHHVGKKEIKKFYRKYYPEKLDEETRQTVNHKIYQSDNTLPPCVICDIDGTLAWMQNRSPYDRKSVIFDNADTRLIKVLEFYMDNGVNVVFLSEREDIGNCKADTLSWLRTNLNPAIYHKKMMSGEFDMFELHMRKKGDYRPDEIIKKELFDAYVKDYYNPLCVFDDRDKVIDMWRELGLLTCQVERGNF